MNKQQDNFINESKKLYRSYLIQKRASLSLSRRKQASLIACEALFSLTQKASFVLSFASFNHELNLWSLNKRLMNQQRLVLPKIEQYNLRLFKLTSLKDLKINQWNILEPDSTTCEEINPSFISFVFIPGLGFDCETRHRIGYGKGYYDRLLKTFSPQTTCYGVGFKEQKIKNLPFSQHDVRLFNHFLF